MQRIGITGNLGSGKTTIAQIFMQLGIAVYFSDQRAKYLMVHSRQTRQKIEQLFGSEAYNTSGLNNKLIAEKAFADKSLIAQLNAIVHPEVERDFNDWALLQNSSYVLKEAALLIESNSYKNLDKLIVVTAPESMLIKRGMQRDGVSEAKITERLKHQIPQSDKVKLADFVIVNDEQTSVVEQVLSIHRQLVQPN